MSYLNTDVKNIQYPPYLSEGAPVMNGGGDGGGITALTSGVGIQLTPSTITSGAGIVAIANTTVAPGSYPQANITVNAQGQLTAATSGKVPSSVNAGSYTNANITVDEYGIVQAASNGAGGGGGGSGTVTSITTSAKLTVNGTPGATLTTTGTLDLADTGVVAGVYNGVQYCTVNSKGQLTAMIQGNATVVNIKDFGAKCDGVTDDTTAFQQAIQYAQTNALPLFFTGAVRITSSLTITTGLTLYGDGSTVSYLLPDVVSVGVNSFTAIAVQSSTTNPSGSIYFHSFGIKYVNISQATAVTNLTANQAGAITLNNTGSSGYPENIGSILRDLTIVGVDIGINSIRGSQWRIYDCQFSSVGQDLYNPSGSGVTYANAYGILVQNELNSDYGDCYLQGNLFYGCYYGIYYLSGGGLYVLNNKAKGCYHSFVMEYAKGFSGPSYSGDLLMCNNSWEGADQGSIVLRNFASDYQYGTITITGNEICTSGGSQNAITIADTNNKLYGITVTGNVFNLNNTSTTVAASMIGLYVNNVEGINVKGNTFNYSTQGGSTTVTPASFTSSVLRGCMDDAPYAIYAGSVTVNPISNASTTTTITDVAPMYYEYLAGTAVSVGTTLTPIGFTGTTQTITNTFGSAMTLNSGSTIQTFQNTSGQTLYMTFTPTIQVPANVLLRWDLMLYTIVSGTPTTLIQTISSLISVSTSGTINVTASFVYAWPNTTTIGFYMQQNGSGATATSTCTLRMIRVA